MKLPTIPAVNTFTAPVIITAVILTLFSSCDSRGISTVTNPPKPTADNTRRLCYGNKRLVVAVPAQGSRGKHHIYEGIHIRPLQTYRYLFTIDDIYIEHYHRAEYSKGTLYILRRIGSTDPKVNDWHDELWSYREDLSGKKLFSARGIDFRISPDESTAAVLSTDRGNNEALSFINISNGKTVRTFTRESFTPSPRSSDSDKHINPLTWSRDGGYFWCDISFTVTPERFLRIKKDTFSIETFDVSALSLNSMELSLNPDRCSLVFSTYPPVFDADSAREFEQRRKPVRLYHYNLRTKEKRTLAGSVSMPMNPVWINSSTVIYYDHTIKGKKRVVVR
ncbi:MAG TPA: hypothetical protein PKX12_01035 [Spirochaetota bacterium]|nr:hypothetical protein [Spirochaetota bacterium]